MGKAKLLLISLFSLASISCVETLISINVFPDGKYHMKIVSSGDEEDIENNDFIVPRSDQWSTERKKEENDELNQTIHVLSSEALLVGTNLLPIAYGVNTQRYPISVKFDKGFFSDTYILHQIFEGREIDKKYPMLATALVEASSKSDEAMVQTEVIMYCLSKAMEDIGQLFRIDQLLIERMLSRGRTDDTEDTIKQRFEVYEKEVSPLISFYAGDNLIKIDGVGEEEDIYSDLRMKLEPYLI